MWYKQQLEVYLHPRILKALHVTYKGQYSLRFEIKHISQKGTTTQSYPYISKSLTSTPTYGKSHSHCHFQSHFAISPLSSSSGSLPMNMDKCAIGVTRMHRRARQGRTSIELLQTYYETPIFDVRYENHTEYFQQVCIFKMQEKLKPRSEQGRTYLDIHLVSTRKQTEFNQASDRFEQTVKDEVFYTRRLVLNLGQLLGSGKFMILDLRDSQFFAHLDLWVGVVAAGCKLRNNAATLSQFLCSTPEQKRKILQTPPTHSLSSTHSIGQCLHKLTRQHIGNLYQFLCLTIKKSLTQFAKMLRLLGNLQLITQQSTRMLTEERQRLAEWEASWGPVWGEGRQEEEGSKFHERLCWYFGTNNFYELYFHIHHVLIQGFRQENMLICQYVRTIWADVAKVIVELSYEQFSQLCTKDQQNHNTIWSQNCLKFLTPVHPSCTPQTDKPVPISQIDGGNVSPPCPLQGIRESSIKAFQAWRNSFVETQPVYSEDQLSHPLLFLDNYMPTQTQMARTWSFRGEKEFETRSDERGLVVFVHGFKGSDFDLERASNYLLKSNPNIEILRIKQINNSLDYTLQQVSLTVATQIKNYILTSYRKFTTISIIGYSLGGIIARACLTHLSAYRDRFNLLVTFSSPHLGTFATENNLVKFGIWWMTKFGKCTVLEELHTCRDLRNATKSYIKVLSECENISWFKKIVLVSCKEDEFVPHISSRLSPLPSPQSSCSSSSTSSISRPPPRSPPTNSRNPHHLAQLAEMRANLLRHAQRVERVEVWFDNENKKGTLDRLTGRQSHIEFIDNFCFHRWFFLLYGSQL